MNKVGLFKLKRQNGNDKMENRNYVFVNISPPVDYLMRYIFRSVERPYTYKTITKIYENGYHSKDEEIIHY